MALLQSLNVVIKALLQSRPKIRLPRRRTNPPEKVLTWCSRIAGDFDAADEGPRARVDLERQYRAIRIVLGGRTRLYLGAHVSAILIQLLQRANGGVNPSKRR